MIVVAAIVMLATLLGGLALRRHANRESKDEGGRMRDERRTTQVE